MLFNFVALITVIRCAKERSVVQRVVVAEEKGEAVKPPPFLSFSYRDPQLIH
jgi:hypothetical protein